MTKQPALHFFFYGLRIAGGAVGYVAAMGAGMTWLAAVGALMILFSAFSLAHDLVHGTMGLSPRGRRWTLAAVAQLFLVSGQAMRMVHLRHHARPFEEDDLEGGPARVGLVGLLMRMPVSFLAMRAIAFRHARGRAARLQHVAENALNAALAAAGLAVPLLRPYVVVALAMQILAPLWGGYLPHKTPAWLMALARHLTFTRSPTVLNLVYHQLHHEHPHVPCHDLVELAAGHRDFEGLVGTGNWQLATGNRQFLIRNCQ